MLSLLPVLLVSRFWILRHQHRQRKPGGGKQRQQQQHRVLEEYEWLRDGFFTATVLMCIASTGSLAWYCWRSIAVYEQAAVVVDRKIMEAEAEAKAAAASSAANMTSSQVAALLGGIQAEREANIEGLATVMLLDPWYRKVCNPLYSTVPYLTFSILFLYTYFYYSAFFFSGSSTSQSCGS